jgi:hypothetical protein
VCLCTKHVNVNTCMRMYITVYIGMCVYVYVNVYGCILIGYCLIDYFLLIDFNIASFIRSFASTPGSAAREGKWSATGPSVRQ